MGSPDFAVPCLDALVASKRYRPLLVVSQPDRGKGRGRKVSPTPVRQRAIDLDIPTRVMTRDNYDEVASEVLALKPDVVVVVAFGMILQTDLLEGPRLGCVNVHASRLPKYRGTSPVQAAILAGDAMTGNTTMRIDEGIDTGDMLLQSEIEISNSDTAGTLTARLAEDGGPLLVKTLDGLFDGSITPRVQPPTDAPHTKKIRKTHGRIRWSHSARDVDLRIRAMSPWPSAYTFFGGRRVIVLDAVPRAHGNVDGERVGTILSLDPFLVQCGEGTMEVLRVKPEGKGAMDAQAFARGAQVNVGDRFRPRPDGE